eukprot:8059816-Heterocapsa_arctica.AAC.2
MQMVHKQRGQHPMIYQPMEDYEVFTTNIQTDTTERLRNTLYARGTMEQHGLMGHRAAMREEDRPM